MQAAKLGLLSLVKRQLQRQKRAEKQQYKQPVCQMIKTKQEDADEKQSTEDAAPDVGKQC